MSKDETFIQWLKIVLAIGGIALFTIWAGRVIELLTIIANKL